ncbi:MAG: class I SAM-dependent methyltransferase [Dehalococcoidia bacterium]
MPDVDFEAAYRGTPPWDIGRPQAAIVALADAGRLVGEVLDVGCGTGEHALLAAARGLPATGVDAASVAIGRAREKARERRLDARFVVGDALALESLGQQFDTVIDTGLFHVFDDEDRDRYVSSLGRVVRSGGSVLLLCFSDRVPPLASGPRRVSEDELRRAFLDGWEVVRIEAAEFEVGSLAVTAFPALLAIIARR